MSQQSEQALERRHQLSALMDGEVDEPCVAQVCAVWRDDPTARRTWHAWHLIGDVLRSEDLASEARRDAVFLSSLRSALGSEPVVLAPDPVSTARRPSRRGWATAGAVAAGFAAVIGVTLLMNGLGPSAQAPVLAQREAPPSPQAVAAAVPVVQVAAPVPDPQVLVADGKLIRDARLDRYLAAHKPFGGNPALALPSGFVRARTAPDGNGGR
jgi:sigma-E factor negative regulatory protein RseA